MDLLENSDLTAGVIRAMNSVESVPKNSDNIVTLNKIIRAV